MPSAAPIPYFTPLLETQTPIPNGHRMDNLVIPGLSPTGSYYLFDVGGQAVPCLNVALSVPGEPDIEAVTALIDQKGKSMSLVVVRSVSGACPLSKPVERVVKFSRREHSPALADALQLATPAFYAGTSERLGENIADDEEGNFECDVAPWVEWPDEQPARRLSGGRHFPFGMVQLTLQLPPDLHDRASFLHAATPAGAQPPVYLSLSGVHVPLRHRDGAFWVADVADYMRELTSSAEAYAGLGQVPSLLHLGDRRLLISDVTAKQARATFTDQAGHWLYSTSIQPDSAEELAVIESHVCANTDYDTATIIHGPAEFARQLGIAWTVSSSKAQAYRSNWVQEHCQALTTAWIEPTGSGAGRVDLGLETVVFVDHGPVLYPSELRQLPRDVEEPDWRDGYFTKVDRYAPQREYRFVVGTHGVPCLNRIHLPVLTGIRELAELS